MSSSTSGGNPHILASLALIPEHVPEYVRAVSGLELRWAGGLAVYVGEADAVMAGYPTAESLEQPLALSENAAWMDTVEQAVREVMAWNTLRRIHVLAPQALPAFARQASFRQQRDVYLAVNIADFTPGEAYAGISAQKLRNTLRRAARELQVEPEAWSSACGALATSYATRPLLDPGTRSLFTRLEAYARSPDVRLFAARDAHGRLQGFCLADYTPLATAFYQFAFRAPDAIPGTADLLLAAVLQEARLLGHERVNLGLGINNGIGFFKRKWGAGEWLPLVESSWELPPPKRFFSRLWKGKQP